MPNSPRDQGGGRFERCGTTRLSGRLGYTLLPIYAMEYNPVALARSWLDLDRYINRLIVKPRPA